MRSFALSSLIPLAFGILASAAPPLVCVGGSLAVPDGVSPIDPDGNFVSCTSLSPGFDNLGGSTSFGALADDNLRRDGKKSLESILCGVVSSIDALVDEIFNLGTVGCTVQTLDPILTEVKDALNGAINQANGLKGLAIGTILNSADGVLDATGLAKLLANVVIIVVKLVNLVLGLVSSVVKDDVLSLLVDILCLVGELLTCVLGLVGSVLTGVPAILGVLVKDVLFIFVQLKIQVVIDLFKP